MGQNFVKLFSSITESTVWCEPDRTRLVWITMLAMATSKGEVWGSIPGLASRARVPIEDCRTAIDTFLSPDRDSRSLEYEGRRIEKINGGWKLLNYVKFRELRDENAIRESKRLYMRRRRQRENDQKNLQINAENVQLVTKKVDT